MPWERVPYMSTLEVCSRRGAVQIHVYLSLRRKLVVNDISESAHHDCPYAGMPPLLMVCCLYLFVSICHFFFFFLLARQPNGNDEVEIRCLHSCLSRTMSIASFMFSCKQFKSSCILLIHFLHGRPLLRLPVYSNAVLWLADILDTWPNHVRRLLFITSTTVSGRFTLFLISSFFILFSLVTPSILLRQLISMVSNLRSSSFLIVQHSAPYSRTGITSTWYTITLVFMVISICHLQNVYWLFVAMYIVDNSNRQPINIL